jgi:hypothetical protein
MMAGSARAVRRGSGIDVDGVVVATGKVFFVQPTNSTRPMSGHQANSGRITVSTMSRLRPFSRSGAVLAWRQAPIVQLAIGEEGSFQMSQFFLFT